MKSFEDLKVWQKAHTLTLQIYKTTKTFPEEEKFGLTSQLRRSTSSIPANIVEGFKKRSDKDFLHFLNIADASLEEAKYHTMLCKDLGYIESKDFHELYNSFNEVGKMLGGLQNSIRKL